MRKTNNSTNAAKGFLLTATEVNQRAPMQKCKFGGRSISELRSSWYLPAKLYDYYPKDRFLALSDALADNLVIEHNNSLRDFMFRKEKVIYEA